MLILTRRVDETIIIGNDITVTVLAVRGSQARVGVVAPKEVSIHREEVYWRILREEIEACTLCKGTPRSACDKHRKWVQTAIGSGG